MSLIERVENALAFLAELIIESQSEKPVRVRAEDEPKLWAWFDCFEKDLEELQGPKQQRLHEAIDRVKKRSAASPAAPSSARHHNRTARG